MPLIAECFGEPPLNDGQEGRIERSLHSDRHPAAGVVALVADRHWWKTISAIDGSDNIAIGRLLSVQTMAPEQPEGPPTDSLKSVVPPSCKLLPIWRP
jgi:hypothetical protein